MKNPNLTCLFAHYNSRNDISQYVFFYLKHLSELGFKIIFISNSAVKPECKTEFSEKVVDGLIYERTNEGHDFGAWSWAISNNVIPDNTDYLLLTNDSLYGPIFPLSPILEAMQSKQDIDFWGLTESYEWSWHLQSYFLVLSRKVFHSDAFKKVFTQQFGQLSKLDVIKKGEVQLSKLLSDSRFKGSAYFAYKELDPDFDGWDSKNPTLFFWEQLIEKFHFPFVKKELILQNPENIPHTDRIFSLLETHSSYPIDNIKKSISEYLATHDSPKRFPNKISVLCHLYYQESIYYFLTRIMALKSPETQFIFNLSRSLYHNSFFREMLTKYFPAAFVIYTPNQGRDIGGKLAAYDVLMKTGIETDYTLIIHDKLSSHAATGTEWRNKLLKIINDEELLNIFRKFQLDKEIGVICNKELIQNEFDAEKKRFTCTSNENLLRYIRTYNLNTSDYNFTAGTIFWIRTEILGAFFSKHPPLSVRQGFEKGNSLDFEKGTNIHAWERLFSFIAHSQGFKTAGI